MIGFKKSSFMVTAAAIALSLDGAIAPRVLQFASAATPARSAAISQKVSITFVPKKTPKITEPTGSRGCKNDGQNESDNDRDQKPPNLMALLPYYEDVNHPFFTVAERPQILFYIPKTSAREASFRVVNEEKEDDLYIGKIDISGNPGIVSISLPANAPPLEIGKTYRLYFSLICSPENTPLDEGVVYRSVERIELSPALAKELENAAPLQQAELYAQNGIWTEALAVLAQLRRAQPDDAKLAAEWQELLNSVKLNDIAEKPLLDAK